MARSRAWSPPGRAPDMRLGCASGARLAARALGRTFGRSYLPISPERKLRSSTRAVGRLGGWAVRSGVFLALLLTAEPPKRLAAQGVLNSFSYDNLRLSGIQLDVGLIGASD